MTSRLRKKFTGTFLSGIVIVLALLFLFPFYWMMIGAFKLPGAISSIPPQYFPVDGTLRNFETLFTKYQTFRWLFNSVFVSIITVIFACLFCTMAGYSLGKKQYPGRQIIFWLLIAVMAVPKNTSMVPLFILMNKLDMIDTYAGLILPLLAWPFGIFLMKQYAQTLPTELLEAAKIDGSSEINTFVKIIIPLVKPGIAALAIFCFKDTWNDYFWQLIIIKSNSLKTLPLAIIGISQETELSLDYGIMMAGSVLATLPMIVLFFSFQQFFTKGLTMGAVKG